MYELGDAVLHEQNHRDLDVLNYAVRSAILHHFSGAELQDIHGIKILVHISLLWGPAPTLLPAPGPPVSPCFRFGTSAGCRDP